MAKARTGAGAAAEASSSVLLALCPGLVGDGRDADEGAAETTTLDALAKIDSSLTESLVHAVQ